MNNILTRFLAIGLFFTPIFVPLGLPLTVVLLAVGVLVWTFFEAKSLKPIGLGRQRLKPTLIWGIGLAIALTLVGEIVQPIIERLMGMRSDYSGYGALAGNARLALQLLAYAWISAAIGEEILFRGFLLHQLTAIFGTGNKTRLAAIVAGGVVFGLAHAMQGPFGIVMTGIVGAIFGWAWFRSGRNLWAMMLAHALVDTYGIGMLYLGRYA